MTERTTTESMKAERHPRVDVADVLRGFAVLAIILLHSIEHFNFYSFPDTTGQSTWLNFTDRAIWDGLFFAFGGKAYAIFAMLFGFSFFVQDYNRRARGKDFRARFSWRLLMLLLIAQLDAAFFTAEVLVMYALVGVVLVATCKLPTRTVVWLACVCLLQPVCLWQIGRAVADPSYNIASLNTSAYWAATFDAQSHAGFMETVRVNLWEGQLASLAWAWDHGRIFQTAGLFMLGMTIGRKGWFNESALGGWGRVVGLATVAFFPLHGLDNMAGEYITNTNILKPLHILLSSLANLCFMLMLTGGVIFAYYRTHRVDRLLGGLIPYGRMSMTNYVTQGIIGSALYYNWGLHLQLGITASLGVGVLIFAVQYALCRMWMSRHSRGPLEHLWRVATWTDVPSFLKGKNAVVAE